MRDLRDRNQRLKVTAPVKKYSETSEPPAYEMIRYTGWVKDKHGKKVRSVIRFSWQYDKRTMENYEKQLGLAVHRMTTKNMTKKNKTWCGNDKLLLSMLESIRHTPGFHKSRRQAIALWQHARRRWRKQSDSAWPYGGFTKAGLSRFKTEIKYDADHYLRIEKQKEEKIFRGVRAA